MTAFSGGAFGQQRWQDLALSAESQDLQRSARSHFSSLDPVAGFRTRLTGQAAPARWDLLVDSGYVEIGLPEALGGVGDAIDLAVLLEEAGRSLLADSLTASCSALQVQLAAGVAGSVSRDVPGAVGSAEGYVSDGRVHCDRVDVLDGLDAATLTLVLRAEGEAHMVVVDPASEGVHVTGHERDHDPTRPLASVRLDTVEPTILRTMSAADGEAVLAGARMCVSADLVGLSSLVLERCLDHVTQRRQFGRPLGAFQSLKHKLADAYVELEKARSLTLGTAVRLRDDDGGTSACQLSYFAAATAVTVATQLSALYIQLLGAMGVTFESDAHLYFRRANQCLLGVESVREALRAAARWEELING